VAFILEIRLRNVKIVKRVFSEFKMGLASSQECQDDAEKQSRLAEFAKRDDFEGFKQADKEYFQQLNLAGLGHIKLFMDICEHNKNPGRYIDYHNYQLLKWSVSKGMLMDQNRINSYRDPKSLKWLLKNEFRPDQTTINKIFSHDKYALARPILEEYQLQPTNLDEPLTSEESDESEQSDSSNSSKES